jgi:ABC-type branched-subunit amino acid transport system ATPase component/GNAT superfamily N-acetyltransferase
MAARNGIAEATAHIGEGHAGQRPDRCMPPDGRRRWGRLSVQRQPQTLPSSPRTTEVCLRFGISPRPEPFWVVRDLDVPAEASKIVLLLGASGAGKTAVLQELNRLGGAGRDPDRRKSVRSGLSAGRRVTAAESVVDVGRTRMPAGRAIVDLVAREAGLGRSLAILTTCGIGEPRLWIRPYAELSEGEQFRARLARALSQAERASHTKADANAGRPVVLLCDEFCAVLHRRAAKAIAYNLRKLVGQSDGAGDSRGLMLVAACTHEDIAADLQPDMTVRLQGGGRYVVSESAPRRKPISFFRRLRIERGRKADYEAFGAMHYRCTEELGFVDKVFTLRDGVGGEALGVVVYAHGPMELSLRNRATNGRFVRNPGRLNREVRILRRLVIHPDVRGCGLGHWLVRETLGMVGVPYVECLANMGTVNPVFERAGMERIGECPLPPGRQKMWQQLERLKVDPLTEDFAEQVKRRPAVRRVVRQVVFDWLRATTGGGEKRVARWGPEALAVTFRQLVGSRPVYYLWRR